MTFDPTPIQKLDIKEVFGIAFENQIRHREKLEGCFSCKRHENRQRPENIKLKKDDLFFTELVDCTSELRKEYLHTDKDIPVNQNYKCRFYNK